MRQSLVNSLELSFWSTLIGFVIAFQGAYSISRLGPGVREKALLLSNMTSNFSGLPLAFAFVVILGMHGVVTLILRKMGLFETFDIYSRAGLVVTYTYFQIPLGILLLYPGFDGIREEWKESAVLLGAGTFCVWTRILLPVLAPAMAGTAIILFANAMGAYATAYGLMATNYNIVPIRIASLVAGDIFLKPNLASALALVLTAMLLTLVVVNEVVLKRRGGGGRYEGK
jgi:putative spermidine/putrescine transport system permease protein